ncbi:hypothetical protein P4391_20295 [Bacillus thuringiensis]|nr:hypothetical protein [Bacillus thuringiensis]MED3299733.1 hypothetical protein [Bacillus thuringiensis]
MNYGWSGTIEQFKQLDVQFFVKQLLDHVFELPPLSLRLEVRDS